MVGRQPWRRGESGRMVSAAGLGAACIVAASAAAHLAVVARAELALRRRPAAATSGVVAVISISGVGWNGVFILV